MEVRAVGKYLRLSPRKARLVTDLIRGRPAEEAIAILADLEKAASARVGKVVRSAVANAENNYNLTMENLYVKDARADEGPRMKRVWMRGRGRRDIKVHRMCHITVVVEEREVPTPSAPSGRRGPRGAAPTREAGPRPAARRPQGDRQRGGRPASRAGSPTETGKEAS